MYPKLDNNRNQIKDGDRLILTQPVDGCPAGATGTAVLHTLADGEPILAKSNGRVLVFLDPPWVRDFGYRSDHYHNARALPEDKRNSMYVFYTDYCRIDSPLSLEQYTPEENELFE